MGSTDTANYKMNHTMIRVKDADRSIAFYRDQLGMKLVHEMKVEAGKFTLYFMAYDQPGAPNAGKAMWDRQGLLELTHNWGTETSDWEACSGNQEPRGFGHIAVAVDNVQLACDRLEAAGVVFQKKPSDGRMSEIAFVLDPDGYWVEIIGQPRLKGVKATDVSNYCFNHSMIRVKDPKASHEFYSSVLGMTQIRAKDFEKGKFSLYFYGYPAGQKPVELSNGEAGISTSHYEGLVELTWNWGTESDDTFKGYASGNQEPKGFGHLAVIVDDIEAACKRFEELGVKFQKRLTDGSMKTLAFILDPDGYWIEIIPRRQ